MNNPLEQHRLPARLKNFDPAVFEARLATQIQELVTRTTKKQKKEVSDAIYRIFGKISEEIGDVLAEQRSDIESSKSNIAEAETKLQEMVEELGSRIESEIDSSVKDALSSVQVEFDNILESQNSVISKNKEALDVQISESAEALNRRIAEALGELSSKIEKELQDSISLGLNESAEALEKNLTSLVRNLAGDMEDKLRLRLKREVEDDLHLAMEKRVAHLDDNATYSLNMEKLLSDNLLVIHDYCEKLLTRSSTLAQGTKLSDLPAPVQKLLESHQ